MTSSSDGAGVHHSATCGRCSHSCSIGMSAIISGRKLIFRPFTLPASHFSVRVHVHVHVRFACAGARGPGTWNPEPGTRHLTKNLNTNAEVRTRKREQWAPLSASPG